MKRFKGTVQEGEEILVNYGTFGQTEKLLEYGYVEGGPVKNGESFHISAQQIFKCFEMMHFYDSDIGPAR